MTLPELAITLAIAGILTMVAAPKLRTAMRSYAVEEATQQFMSDLVEAQTLAIKLNRPVTVWRNTTTTYKVDGAG